MLWEHQSDKMYYVSYSQQIGMYPVLKMERMPGVKLLSIIDTVSTNIVSREYVIFNFWEG